MYTVNTKPLETNTILFLVYIKHSTSYSFIKMNREKAKRKKTEESAGFIVLICFHLNRNSVVNGSSERKTSTILRFDAFVAGVLVKSKLVV